jgi:hypothetical protein
VSGASTKRECKLPRFDLVCGSTGTVALSQGASSPRLKAAKQAPQSPRKAMTNWASELCRGASGRADETRSSGPIAQRNCHKSSKLIRRTPIVGRHNMIDKSEERSTRHAVRHLTSYEWSTSPIARFAADQSSTGSFASTTSPHDRIVHRTLQVKHKIAYSSPAGLSGRATTHQPCLPLAVICRCNSAQMTSSAPPVVTVR